MAAALAPSNEVPQHFFPELGPAIWLGPFLLRAALTLQLCFRYTGRALPSLLFWSGSMALDLENDAVFTVAIDGLPRVVELIATFPRRDVRSHWPPQSKVTYRLRKRLAMRRATLSDGRRRSCRYWRWHR